jgi:nitrite reductase/ring-hydroxylating ferredoxin subunit
MAYASHLGGKMVYEHRVGVDRTDGQVFPDEFVAILPESTLADGKPTQAMYQGLPVLLVRRGDHVFAMADPCSHFGGPLSEGKLVGDSIVCPYHSSRFALEDGRVMDGPAVHPQPCLEVRARNGQIEVRKASVPVAPSAMSAERLPEMQVYSNVFVHEETGDVLGYDLALKRNGDLGVDALL